MKKLLMFLLMVICLGVGFSCGYLLYSRLNNNEDNPVKILEEQKSIEYNKDLININLVENLKSRGINPSTLEDLNLLFKVNYEDRKIYQWNDTIFNYGSFNDNDKKIFIDYDKAILSYSKPISNNYTNNSYYVYILSNYYLMIINESQDSSKFKIFNKDLEELFVDMCEGQMAFTNNALYYSTFECTYNNGVSQKEVHRLNLQTMHSSFDFYLDHLAGWKC